MIITLAELKENYEVISGRLPREKDLVFVTFLGNVFEVMKVTGNRVVIERKLGSTAVIPPSQYKLVRKVEK